MSRHEEIEFIFRGKIDKSAISTKNVPISLLTSFSKDVYDLLTSVEGRKSSGDIIVSIEKSSLKIRALVAATTLAAFLSDFDTLSQTKNFASISGKRSSIIENWQNQAKTNTTFEYEIRPSGKDGLKISSSSPFIRSDNKIWVQSELYLYGIVTDLGGSQAPNIHLKIESGETIVIDCTQDDIRAEQTNRVYHPAAIRVLANQNVYTGEFNHAKFISFVDYKPSFNEDVLLKTIELGTNAWSSVEDHLSWIKNLRENHE